MASSYVGGGLSHLVVNVVPRKEKNLEEERKDPVGLAATPLSSARDERTDHWIRALAKQLRHMRRVMARRM